MTCLVLLTEPTGQLSIDTLHIRRHDVAVRVGDIVAANLYPGEVPSHWVATGESVPASQSGRNEMLFVVRRKA